MRDLAVADVSAHEDMAEGSMNQSAYASRACGSLLLITLVFSVSACGRKETGGQVGGPQDGGPTNDGGTTEVQIIRTPGKILGSPASALYVPALDSGVTLSGFSDAGSGRPAE